MTAVIHYKIWTGDICALRDDDEIVVDGETFIVDLDTIELKVGDSFVLVDQSPNWDPNDLSCVVTGCHERRGQPRTVGDGRHDCGLRVPGRHVRRRRSGPRRSA